jgi:hypothetical protein
MNKWLIAGVALFAPFFFPAPFSLGLALFGALWSPWVPLAVGLTMDALYYSPDAFAFPLFSFLGALAAAVSYGVHRFIETSIMRG